MRVTKLYDISDILVIQASVPITNHLSPILHDIANI